MKIDNKTKKNDVHPIHPFPARMAPSIIWESIPNSRKQLRVLDPMTGSGTTLVHVRAMGHKAIGCDTDPLALLIAKAWCSDVCIDELVYRAGLVLRRAIKIYKSFNAAEAYPSGIDLETKQFIDFWFDEVNRCQLTALAKCISRVLKDNERTLLWCAFSRLIITKKLGVSLAMDVSHSRPHKKYEEAPFLAFDKFLHEVNYIVKRAPFNTKQSDKTKPQIILKNADARTLPFEKDSVDIVITSPPYLNAIDYIRGHKLSLVWMGYSISYLRSLRSTNIGSEYSRNLCKNGKYHEILKEMVDVEKLNERHITMALKYIEDMSNVISECRRVIRDKGQFIVVIGDSNINGVFIENSKGLTHLAESNGFELRSKIKRLLPENRRYLPPPSSEAAGRKLQNRMREEAILYFE